MKDPILCTKKQPLPETVSIAGMASMIAGAALISVPFEAKSEIKIDSFVTEQITRLESGTTAYTTGEAAESLGGERDVRVQRISNGKGPVEASAAIPEAGRFSLNTGVGTRGVTTLIWDGADAKDCVNYSGLGGFDLTQGGQNIAFALQGGSDLGAQLRLRVYESVTRYSEYKGLIPAGSDESAVQFLIPFAEFIASDEGAANFSKIGAITLELLGSKAGSDVFIGEFSSVNYSFTPVPEQSTFAAAAFALLVGICGWRNRGFCFQART